MPASNEVQVPEMHEGNDGSALLDAAGHAVHGACDKCWADAFVRSRMLGGSQADHYKTILEEVRHARATSR